MKTLGHILLIFGMMAKTYGLDCYNCDITNWNGESTDSTLCLTPVATGTTATNSVTCPADANGVVNYCRTQVIIRDGVVTEIHRACAASDTDEDVNAAGAPTEDKCTSWLQTSNPSDTTNCYFHCTTDKCNTVTTSSLKQCTSACNNGRCNYITALCQCYSGFSGTDCTTVSTPTALRQCVQCNSATDSNCASSTTSLACPGTEEYCSTATTTILQNGVVVGTPITTRGCSATLKAVDECSFTNIHTDSPISDTPPGYKEYTCISTCETDGCNTNTADGMTTGNEATLKCVVCSDPWGSGACNPTVTFARTACPSTSYCTSTVTYLISMHDEGVDAYQLESVERGCASSTAKEKSSCTETDVITGLKKVTCTETCQEDGCNNRWPTRPTCITCISSNADFADGYNACLENPPQAAVCTYPYDAYCVLQHTGIEKGSLKQMGVKGYPHTISRSCSFKGIGTGCSPSERLRETDVESCNRTCTVDGCNVGSGSTMIFQTVLAVLLPTVLGLIAQMHF